MHGRRTNLCAPKDFTPPSGDLDAAIKSDFGSLDAMVAKFNGAAAAVQGSGWGWLGYDKEAHRLVIASTPNQDPLAFHRPSVVPLLGFDVGEHA